MTASMPMASTVSTVSRRLSPFLTDELATASESTSADSRLAAVSKERRVRVDSSKKSVATTLPRRVGTLGTERRSTSAKASATRSTSAMPSRPRSATESRWRGVLIWSSRVPIQHAVLADVDHLLAPGREVLADEVRPDGQLAVAPVDHDGELDGPGAAEVVQRVEGGPDGAAGEEDVVDQHDDAPGQVDRDVGHRLGQHRAQPDVVAVEGHVERADLERHVALDLAEDLGHPRGQGHAAGLQADQHDVLDAAVALDDLVRHPRQGPLDVGGSEDLGVGHEHAPEGSRMTALAFGHCSSCRVGLTGPTSRSVD